MPIHAAPVPARLFGRSEGCFLAGATSGPGVTIAVTLEPTAGVRIPSGPVVLAGSV